jgi:hypothetical protein
LPRPRTLLPVGLAASKGITVTEFEVIALQILVRDPAGELLQSIDWQFAEGPQTYTVPVRQAGVHQLEVTHFGELNGESVQATESAPVDIRAMVITVIDIVPGSIGVIDIEGGEPPETPDLTGYWDQYLILEDGTTFGPGVTYILQTGNTLDYTMGFTGTIEGTAVTMEGWVEGTFVSGALSYAEGELVGTTDDLPFGGTVTIRLVRTAMSFGRLDLEGSCQGVPVSIYTDYGLGCSQDPEYSYRYGFGWWASAFAGNFDFWCNGELSVGSFEVTNEDADIEDGSVEASFWDTSEYHYATSGTLTITEYAESQMAGTFTLNFDEGSLSGLFTLAFGAGGQVSVQGTWNGLPVSAETSVSSGKSVGKSSHFNLVYLDNTLQATVWLSVPGDIGLGEHEFPGSAWGNLEWRPDGGTEINGEIASGVLTILSYDGSSISGSLEMSFQEGGALSGSFNLPLQAFGMDF